MLHPKLVSRAVRTCEPAPPEHASCRGVRFFLGHVEIFADDVEELKLLEIEGGSYQGQQVY